MANGNNTGKGSFFNQPLGKGLTKLPLIEKKTSTLKSTTALTTAKTASQILPPTKEANKNTSPNKTTSIAIVNRQTELLNSGFSIDALNKVKSGGIGRIQHIEPAFPPLGKSASEPNLGQRKKEKHPREITKSASAPVIGSNLEEQSIKEKIATAVRADNFQPLLEEVKKGRIKLDQKDQYGKTLLHHLSRCQKLPDTTDQIYNIITSAIIQNLSLKHRNSKTLKKKAETLGNNIEKAVRELYGNEIKKKLFKLANTADNSGNTPLHYAILNRDDAFIKMLKEAGADLDAKNKDGLTPAHMAVQANNIKALETLVSLGAKCDVQDKEGKTPLHYAVQPNNLPFDSQMDILCQVMTEKDSKPLPPQKLCTAINRVLHSKFTIKDFNPATRELKDAIQRAYLSKPGDIVERLLEESCKDIVDKKQHSPLDFYKGEKSRKSQKNPKLVKILLQHYRAQAVKKVSKKYEKRIGEEIKTLHTLHFAGGNRKDIIDEALKPFEPDIRKLASSKINTLDSKLRSPLWYAVNNENIGVIQSLVKSGASIVSATKIFPVGTDPKDLDPYQLAKSKTYIPGTLSTSSAWVKDYNPLLIPTLVGKAAEFEDYKSQIWQLTNDMVKQTCYTIKDPRKNFIFYPYDGKAPLTLMQKPDGVSQTPPATDKDGNKVIETPSFKIALTPKGNFIPSTPDSSGQNKYSYNSFGFHDNDGHLITGSMSNIEITHDYLQHIRNRPLERLNASTEFFHEYAPGMLKKIIDIIKDARPWDTDGIIAKQLENEFQNAMVWQKNEIQFVAFTKQVGRLVDDMFYTKDASPPQGKKAIIAITNLSEQRKEVITAFNNILKPKQQFTLHDTSNKEQFKTKLANTIKAKYPNTLYTVEKFLENVQRNLQNDNPFKHYIITKEPLPTSKQYSTTTTKAIKKPAHSRKIAVTQYIKPTLSQPNTDQPSKER